LLIGADADVIYSNDINHFFQAIDIFFEAWEEVPNADRATRLGDYPDRRFAVMHPR
jgi:hypothetical protein